MSEDFVADASTAISWVVSRQSTAVADRLARQVSGGALFYVPVVWFFEVSNVLLILRRRGTITSEEYENGRAVLCGASPVVEDQADQWALTTTADLAAQLGLTVYDAAYLELAQRSHLALASRDGRLLAAASLCGVATIDAR